MDTKVPTNGIDFWGADRELVGRRRWVAGQPGGVFLPQREQRMEEEMQWVQRPSTPVCCPCSYSVVVVMCCSPCHTARGLM